MINAEGHAHIFDIQPKNQSQSQHISAEDYLGTGRRTSDTASIQAFRRMMSGNGPTMPPPLNEQQQQEFNKNNTNQNTKHQIQDLEKPNITLKVPVNVNKILIADIGRKETILTNT